MSVTASRPLHPRGWPVTPAQSGDRPPPATLRITVDLPLHRVPLPPQAARLLELIHELIAEPTGGVGRFEIDPGDRPGATVLRHPATDPRGRADPRLRLLVGPRVVLLDDAPVPLTRLEFDLLRFLAAHPRQVFTRRQLLRSVWRDDLGLSRTVDVHVRRLRAKLGPDLPVVTTVYGVGYRLADDARIAVQGDR